MAEQRFSGNDWTGSPTAADLEALALQYQRAKYLKSREPGGRGSGFKLINELASLLVVDERVSLVTLEIKR